MSFWCRGDSNKIVLTIDPLWLNLCVGKWQIAVSSTVFIQKTEEVPQVFQPLLLTSNIVSSQYSNKYIYI